MSNDAPAEIRRNFVERLREDLIGPGEPEEVLADRPSDRYLTGILFPRRSRIPDAENEQLGLSGPDEAEAESNDSVPLAACIRPSSMGFSFCVSSSPGHQLELLLTIAAGIYQLKYATTESESLQDEGQRTDQRWVRQSLLIDQLAVRFRSDGSPEFDGKAPGTSDLELDQYGIPGMVLHLRTAPIPTGLAITAVLINQQESTDHQQSEERAFFQTSLCVTPGPHTNLTPRPSAELQHSDDAEDDASGRLIYRDIREYAVGHACAVTWHETNEGRCDRIETNWLPSEFVPAVSHEGDSVFPPQVSAGWLATADRDQVLTALSGIGDAYGRWITDREKEIPSLNASFTVIAQRHRETWVEAHRRIRNAVEYLADNDDAFRAFRMANEAMAKQRRWLDGGELRWRPFQIGFQLLVLQSLLEKEDDHRDVMDLLWFPTGGGKTEAYLSLMAAAFFYRRLRSLRDKGDPDLGAGVGVIMRYTLRLLTTQQFERAARMVCACDTLRRKDPEHFGQIPISIGLWVGSAATSNTVSAARSDSAAGSQQIKNCPCCGSRLRWPENNRNSYECFCQAPEDRCELAAAKMPLPIWTVDEDLYRELPSLLIGTIDKFAQIVRRSEPGRFFGVATRFDAPDLILQDELHLITGPLGTIAGIYEVAVDELCRHAGGKPKIIGSTATIKRARNQVLSLFDREVFQFPPPGLDPDNSCFAVRDNNKPGRLYVGVTTAGRSPKFTLQAVCASLLQSSNAGSIPESERDDYWTLLTYFNSLKELGGAHVMMLDDVPKSISDFARRRDEPARRIEEPEELSSNLKQAQIPEVLGNLSISCEHDGVCDAALATNMISVGMDIPRLALMVVNGQPKTIAEYIQATSRVGRAHVPGLVVTVFNAAKARDRSHYENFATWHRTLYRDVEASSVTPFASRAQDKALHSALVAMIRHLVPGMSDSPNLTRERRRLAEPLIRAIEERAERIDHVEGTAVREKLRVLLDEWESRGKLARYWNDRDYEKHRPLMMSAEAHAAQKAAGINRIDIWPTLNSMRDVEPSCDFRLVEVLRVEEDCDAQ